MKKILVTGCAGFVESHLCARLINEGHDIIFWKNILLVTKKHFTFAWQSSF